MELEISGFVLKNFRSALQCLSKLGEDLDFSCAPDRLSVSTVNSSRTAFGIVHFYPRFFTRYDIADQDRNGTGASRRRRSHTSGASQAQAKFRFSVTGKALLSTLRPRSASTVESCILSVHDSEDPQTHHEPGVDSGECRIIVSLQCQHGVRKKHSLTYSTPAVQSWARFDLNTATCNWTASSRVLKDWMAHFHERTGGAGGGGGGAGGTGTDEVTFYCSRGECRLKSFNDVDRSGPSHDVFATRSLSTEVTVDTEDFDAYNVPSRQVVTFAQREFKAIINFAEPLQTTLTARFSGGGRPIMFSLDGEGGAFQAVFVVATTDFDSGPADGDGADGVKREKSESLAHHFAGAGAGPRRSTSAVPGSSSQTGAGARNGRPLFNAPTPSPAPPNARAPSALDKGKGKASAPEPDPTDYAAVFDDDENFDDAFFAELDRATQQAMESQSQRVRPARSQANGQAHSGIGQGHSSAFAPISVGAIEREQRDASDALGYEQEHEGADNDLGGHDEGFVWQDVETQLGPTQREASGSGSDGEGGRSVKRARWNLLGDG